MKPSTKNKAKGTFHEVKGKVKEKVGRATNNPDLEAEGQVEQIGGRSKRKSAKWRKSSEHSGDGSAWSPAEALHSHSANDTKAGDRTTSRRFNPYVRRIGLCDTVLRRLPQRS